MKALWLSLIILLTVYASIELTRVIIVNRYILKLGDIPQWQFAAEMAIFWALYCAGMVVVYKRIK